MLLAAVLIIGLVPEDLIAGNSGLETYGDVGQIAIPVAAGLISGWRKDTDGLIQLGTSSLVTFGIVQGLKYTIDRERPNGGGLSFPSGHTSAAFSGASYLHYRYGWQYGTPAYLAAVVVGYSRVAADEHFVEDVIAGAAIANIMAFILTDSIDENVVIVPIFNTTKRNFGLLVSFGF